MFPLQCANKQAGASANALPAESQDHDHGLRRRGLGCEHTEDMIEQRGKCIAVRVGHSDYDMTVRVHIWHEQW
jgi:hypothetical protein